MIEVCFDSSQDFKAEEDVGVDYLCRFFFEIHNVFRVKESFKLFVLLVLRVGCFPQQFLML